MELPLLSPITTVKVLFLHWATIEEIQKVVRESVWCVETYEAGRVVLSAGTLRCEYEVTAEEASHPHALPLHREKIRIQNSGFGKQVMLDMELVDEGVVLWNVGLELVYRHEATGHETWVLEDIAQNVRRAMQGN